MEGKEAKAWKISPEALELEFVRQSLTELGAQARKFAIDKGITYELDDDSKRERLRIFPVEGDFDSLRKHMENLVATVNDLFTSRGTNYYLDTREYNNGLHIEAVKAKK